MYEPDQHVADNYKALAKAYGSERVANDLAQVSERFKPLEDWVKALNIPAPMAEDVEPEPEPPTEQELYDALSDDDKAALAALTKKELAELKKLS